MQQKVRRFSFTLLLPVLLAAASAIADEQPDLSWTKDMHAAYCFETLKYLIAGTISARDGLTARLPPLAPNANDQLKQQNEEVANERAALKRQLDSDIIAMKADAEQLRLFMLGRMSPKSSDDGVLTGTAMARADISVSKTPIPEDCYPNGEYLNGKTPDEIHEILRSDFDHLKKCSSDATRPYLEPIGKKWKTCRDISWLF
jgi:hypothetical protein